MSHTDLHRFLDFGGRDDYRKLDLSAPAVKNGALELEPEAMAELARIAFSEIAFKYPVGHLELLAAILRDEKAGGGEKFVAETLLRNAAIAAEGILPMCQDTGTALVYGWKGEGVGTAGGADAAEALGRGAAAAYAERRLRKSQLGPLSATGERNTGDNLPAAIDLRAVPGDSFRLLFAAKGGGSTGKTSLSMESPAILRPEALEKVLAARIGALGASACPPYSIAVALGGATPSQALYAMELAAWGLLDRLPAESAADGTPLRSAEWEAIVERIAAGTGVGAQWGGRHLALEARFIRLARHAANLPLAVGVSCSAHRKARAYVDSSGWYLERLEEDPARLLPASRAALPGAVRIDLDAPRETWLEALRRLPAGSAALLSGTVTVARDLAHARIAAAMESGAPPPAYFVDHPIFYAGPTDPAPGAVTGSFGPTTAARMDPYLAPFTAAGASLVTIAKGPRGKAAAEIIAAARGVYLAGIGGAAAIAAREQVAESRIVDHEDLGMEAVRLVKLRDYPAIVVIDASGASFYH
ncbi:fumarate hydratase [bacterium]|nr:fumarate hydratase [bacterium]